jgi:cytochrome oxidase Cu insertion factor (SCO1/SenC/PrrC family)
MRRLVACLALLLTALPGCRPAVSPLPDEMEPLPLPDFTLTERSGRTVSKADLAGKVWVAAFVFTRCSGPCPSVSATMARLQHELKDLPDFRLVTFTVDPDRDQLKDLNAYADERGADRERWLFLTGEKDKLYRLFREGFHVAVEQGKDKEGRPDVTHSTRLALVDRQGRIRGYYQGLANVEAKDGLQAFEDNLKKLRDKAAALAAEAP